MYFPKRDEAFGSFYFYISMPQYHGVQSYRLERTHYKTLRTESQRCDNRIDGANTTTCITHYLEQMVGCSMGMYGTDPGIKRYQLMSLNVVPQAVQPADIGWPTGNRKKLSSTQAQLGQATCWAVV